MVAKRETPSKLRSKTDTVPRAQHSPPRRGPVLDWSKGRSAATIRALAPPSARTDPPSNKRAHSFAPSSSGARDREAPLARYLERQNTHPTRNPSAARAGVVSPGLPACRPGPRKYLNETHRKRAARRVTRRSRDPRACRHRFQGSAVASRSTRQFVPPRRGLKSASDSADGHACTRPCGTTQLAQPSCR